MYINSVKLTFIIKDNDLGSYKIILTFMGKIICEISPRAMM